MLESIFSKLLILSVQAGFLILATIFIRGIFKKIPKKYICLLWCMVGLRLLIPVTIESPVSLVPSEHKIEQVFEKEAVEEPIVKEAEQEPENVYPSLYQPDVEYTYTYRKDENAVSYTEGNKNTADLFVQERKAPDLRMLMIYLWLFGVVILLGYGVFTYIRVRRKVRDAVHHEANIWLSDRIDTPFLLGYIKPRIYMPFFVDESRREYIIAHERGHIERGDHITKLIGYILLAVYWFQPLVWVAYVMFCKDVEMACDEKVIGNLGEEKKKAYSQTLLLCSVDKHYLLANPLAFGEIDVKKRIINVLSYKKPGVIISIVSVIVLLLVAVFFMTNGQETPPEEEQPSEHSVVENVETETTPAPDKVLADYQMEYLTSLESGTHYAVVPLDGAEEPILLTAKGYYEDPAFDNAKVTISAEYCMFGEVKGISTGGTAYPIRSDYEAIYLASGHSLTVLTVSEDVDPETGSKYMETTVYSENHEKYWEVLEQCHAAFAVDFENTFTKEKDVDFEAVLEEMERQINAQLEIMEAEKEALEKEQENLLAFRAQFGTPVRTTVKNDAEEEYLAIAKAVFDEYNKMDALFSTSLPISGSWDTDERYAEVESDMFPNAKAVKDYIRQFCGEALTEWHYYGLFRDGEEEGLLKEENGKLYTAMFDGIPVAYTEYDSISILEASSDRMVYNIWPSAPFFEERDAVYFVQIAWEDDRWVVEECAPVMTKGSHDYYPETVYQRITMEDYEVVLQDYTTRAGGPLEVAVIRGDESETLKVLYEDWQRDPATLRLADVGEIFGYDCFYVYDFGLFHTVVIDFYAMVDGEIQQVAGSWGDDPEKSTFIRDLDGDGRNELICNLTFSADGRQGVRIYKRDGDRILYNYDGAESFAGLDAEYAGYANSQYDAESGKIVVCGYKDEEYGEFPWEIDMSVLEFGEYTPGY